VGRRADHARRYQARFRPHAGFILAHAGFAALFVALVLSAFHAPSPHNLPVGIVAPAAVTGQVEDALNSGAQSDFDLHVYRSPALARAAIAHREVDGAAIASPAGLRLLVADAGGSGPAQALTRAFGVLAARSGRPLAITDVVPPGPGDTQALSPFFIILGVLVPSLATGSASALLFRRSRPAWCVAAPVAVAAVIGVTAAGVADGVSGLGHFAAIAGLVALFSLAVSAPTAALGRLWPPLVSIGVLVFLVLGIPASGGPANLARFTPALLRFLQPALPLGAAADAVRNAVYFGGYGTAGPAWVLVAWALAGVAALTLVVTLKRRAAPSLLPASARPGVGRPARILANGSARPAGVHAAAMPAHLAPPASLAAGVHPGPGAPVGAPSATATRPRTATLAEPAPDPLTPATIVVGFDNSGPARRALAWAARLAATRSADLLVVYADHAIIDSDLSGFARAEMDATRDQEAAVIEQAATQIAAAAGLGCTFQRLPSAPADAILAAASQAAVGGGRDPLIVVGRSGHAAHHVLGSAPVRLQHHSPYPVLTIP
jgi:nucleotide-binding universal stress UspA family protein